MAWVMDQQTARILAGLYPDFRVRVVRILNDVFDQTGMTMRVTDGLRSFEQQTILYNQGRTSSGPVVTNAEPGMSYHTYGIACDCCWKGNDPYLANNSKHDQLWKSYGVAVTGNGLVWGGLWQNLPDMPHCEMHYGGLTCAQLKEIYLYGGLDGVFKKLDSVIEWKPGINS